MRWIGSRRTPAAEIVAAVYEPPDVPVSAELCKCGRRYSRCGGCRIIDGQQVTAANAWWPVRGLRMEP